MQPGFMPDVGYGSIQAGRWVEGAPEKGWTGNVKTRGRLNIVISAERCTACGFLELYAKP
jgi:hypothetical protein